MSVRLKCLGVGHGGPSLDRNYSSFLYRNGQDGVLLDCGEPLTRSWFSSGLDCNLFEGIVLSHLHFDHLGGFPMFIQALWLAGRKRDLAVYLPSDGIVPLQQLLRAGCLFDELLSFRIHFEPLRAGPPLRLGGFDITPVLNSHLAPFKRAYGDKYPLEFASFSFRLETERAKIIHSADIGAPEDLEPLFQEKPDALVCELAHFTPDHLFLWLKERPVKKCVFVHLDPKSWTAREELRQLAESRLPAAEVHFPSDGEEILFEPM
jgi:ribonuclease BN (tRNA processing enzyme)